MELIKTPADQIHPVEKSMAGTNANYHYCDKINHRQSYAVCLHTIAAVNRGGEQDLALECAGPILSGSCPALKLQAEEKAAGKSLYYNDRADNMKRIDLLLEEAGIKTLDIRYGKRGQLAKEPLSARNFEMRQAQQARQEEAIGNPTQAAPPVKVEVKEAGLDAKLINRNLIAEAINGIMGEKGE